MQLEGSVKESLKEFLNANTNVMAYSIIEMSKVDPNTIVYFLNIRKYYKLSNRRSIPLL